MGKLAAVRFARSTPDTVVNALQPLLETHGFRVYRGKAVPERLGRFNDVELFVLYINDISARFDEELPDIRHPSLRGMSVAVLYETNPQLQSKEKSQLFAQSIRSSNDQSLRQLVLWNAPIPFYPAEPFLSKVTLRSLLGQIGQTVAGPANAVARRKTLADYPEWKVPVISRKHVLEMLYDEEAYKIIGHLTNPTKRSSCDCVGISGMVGCGKSWLAKRVAHSAQVQEAFGDHVLWLDCTGKNLSEVVAEFLQLSIRARQLDCGKVRTSYWRGSKGSIETAPRGSFGVSEGVIRETFMNKKYLFVLDNVQSLAIAERMSTVLTMMGKSNGWRLKLQTLSRMTPTTANRVLFTTRISTSNQDAGSEIHIYDLGSHRQRPSEAFVEIALRSSPEWSLMADLTDKRNKFHKLLPKVIELYGAHVTVTSLLGSNLDGPFLAQLLDRPDAILSRQVFYPLVHKILGHIEAFAAEHKDLVDRLFDLACFMKDGAFEEADVEALWTSRTDGVDVATALDALCSWNLVSRKYDAYIVHPVIWLLLSDVRMRDRFEQCPVVELHQSLLSELAESSTAGSPWLESVAQSPYFQSSLVRHMLTAGELERIVVEVLLQSTWILHKLRQNRSSSVTSLLDDYSLLLELLKKQQSTVDTRPLRWIKQAVYQAIPKVMSYGNDLVPGLLHEQLVLCDWEQLTQESDKLNLGEVFGKLLQDLKRTASKLTQTSNIFPADGPTIQITYTPAGSRAKVHCMIAVDLITGDEDFSPFYPSTKVLLMLTEDDTIVWYDMETSKKLRSQILDAEQRAQSMDYHQLKDGQRLIAIGHNYARISILSFDTGKLVKSCQQNTANVFPVTGIKLCDFDDSRPILVVGSEMRPLEVWDYHSMNAIRCIRKGCLLYGLARSETAARSKLLTVNCGTESSIAVWNLKTTKSESKLLGHSSPIISIDVLTTEGIDPAKRSDSYGNANVLCVSGSWHSIRLWNVDAGNCLREIVNQRTEIPDVLFYPIDPQNLLLISSARDGTISLWLAEESGALLENLSLNERGGSIRSVAMVSGETRRIPYSSDAFVSIKRNLLVSTSKLGSMSVYDLDNLPLESRS